MLYAPKPTGQFSNFNNQIEGKRTDDKASELIKTCSSKCRGHIGLPAKQMNNTFTA